jgi:hypothetical protein
VVLSIAEKAESVFAVGPGPTVHLIGGIRTDLETRYQKNFPWFPQQQHGPGGDAVGAVGEASDY